MIALSIFVRSDSVAPLSGVVIVFAYLVLSGDILNCFRRKNEKLFIVCIVFLSDNLSCF